MIATIWGWKPWLGIEKLLLGCRLAECMSLAYWATVSCLAFKPKCGITMMLNLFSFWAAIQPMHVMPLVLGPGWRRLLDHWPVCWRGRIHPHLSQFSQLAGQSRTMQSEPSCGRICRPFHWNFEQLRFAFFAGKQDCATPKTWDVYWSHRSGL